MGFQKYIFVYFTCFFFSVVQNKTFAQTFSISPQIKLAFKQAYISHPNIPKGLLEAVSYANTRIKVIHSEKVRSCIGMPIPTGIMGLFEDGKGYFSNNLVEVAQISGFDLESIKKSFAVEINAYAVALAQKSANFSNTNAFVNYLNAVKTLDALPIIEGNTATSYSKDAFLYQVYWFLVQPEFQDYFEFSAPNFNPINYFGKDNFAVLSSSYVLLSDKSVSTHGISYAPEKAGTDYAPAISTPAATCNYSSRSGTAISAVTIHTIQGNYASCINWFQNCAASVSAHYVMRSSDGQVTQMVIEADKAWHVGSENSYTIGIEHEGFIADSTWYTNAMYNSSADLVRDICNSGYGISPLRTAYFPWTSTTIYAYASIPGSCIKIKGHQHFPNQSHVDPGQYWNWDFYYKLINDNTAVQVETSGIGTIEDSGGSAGNYSNDERKIYTIQPNNVHDFSLTFTEFNLEDTWDYLYIYDGTDVFAPRIGIYTGNNSPGTIVPNSGAVTIEFRSDCATTKTGYAFRWTSKPNLPSEGIQSTFHDNTSGLNELNKQAFKVYPSPFQNTITIEQNTKQTVQLTIFDLTGKMVKSKQLNKTSNTIHLSKLQSGVYFLRLTNKDVEKTLKVVKQ